MKLIKVTRRDPDDTIYVNPYAIRFVLEVGESGCGLVFGDNEKIIPIDETLEQLEALLSDA